MEQHPSRRDFAKQSALSALGALSLGSLALDPAETHATERPADLPQQTPPAANLGTLFDEVEQLAGRGEYPFSFLNERFTSFDTFRPEARAQVLDAFAYRPAPVEPKAEVLDRVDLGDYVREKVVFSTSPVFRVPAYVLIPKGLKGRAPAIVDLHSHGGMFLFGKEKITDLGDNLPTMTAYHARNYEGRPTATALVKRGYVVIAIDALMFGERRVLLAADAKRGWDRAKYSAEDVQHLNGQCRARESTIVKGLTLAGLTWPGIVTWDDMRTVDYLVTRPEVDPERIGCLGVSFGGHRSLFLGGLDDRIRAACVTGFMSTVRPMIERHLDTHSFVHFVPHLHRWMDLPDVAALRAPMPLMVQQCSQDGLFPLAGMQAAVEKMAAIYHKAGAAERFVGKFYDVPHSLNIAMQDEAFAFFDKHLKRV
jgi:dienelactone hydrolase